MVKLLIFEYILNVDYYQIEIMKIANEKAREKPLNMYTNTYTVFYDNQFSFCLMIDIYF